MKDNSAKLLYVVIGILILIAMATVFKKQTTETGNTRISAFGKKIFETKAKPKNESKDNKTE